MVTMNSEKKLSRRGLLKGGAAMAGAALLTPSFNLIGKAADAQGADGPVILIVGDDAIHPDILRLFFARYLMVDPWSGADSGRRLGIDCAQAYTGSPSCGSGRAGFASGLYAHQTGFLTHDDHHLTDSNWLAQHSFICKLREQGIYTVGTGKAVHHSQKPEEQGGAWDEYQTWIRPELDWRDFNPQLSTYESGSWAPHGRTFGAGPKINHDHDKVSWALDRVRNATNGHLVVISVDAPHVRRPSVQPQRFYNPQIGNWVTMPDDGPPMSEEEAAFSDAFAHDLAGLKAYGELESWIAWYAAAWKEMDFQIGRIIRAAPSNARFIFTSDHGMALGVDGRITKQTPGTDVSRVPLYIWGAGISPTTLHTPVSLIDVGATVFDLFGLPHDGESIIDLAQQPTDRNRAVYVSYRMRQQLRDAALAKGHADMFTTVYRGGHGFTQLINSETMEVRQEELNWTYSDPFSQTDLSERPWEQDTVDQMRDLMPTNYEGITQ